jgi:uncharacterized delta-60 repeat protein
MHPRGRIRLRILHRVLAAWVILGGVASAAPPLRLDPGFGDHGVAGGRAAVTRGLAEAGTVDGHGRAVVAVRGAVIRFRADGSVDRSFGRSGRVTLPVGSPADRGVRAVTTAGNGSVVVATERSAGGTALWRLRPDGSLDSAFGSGGTTTVPMSVADMALRSGVLHLAGSTVGDPTSVTPVPALARLGGATGAPLGPVRALAPPPGTTGSAFVPRIAVQADGRTVALVRGPTASGGSRFAVRRVDGDGVPDASFGSDGVVPLPGGFGDLDALALTRGGRIVVAGQRGGHGTGRAAIVRLLPSGARDRAFGRGGTAVSAAQNLAEHIVALPDGSLVTTGARTALRFSARGAPLGRAVDLAPHRSANFVAGAGGFHGRVIVIGTRFVSPPRGTEVRLRTLVTRLVRG